MTKKISFRTKKGREGIEGAADAWIHNRNIPDITTENIAVEDIIMKRFTIDIPADLHRQFKTYCAEQGYMMADVVRAMLEEKLRNS